MDIENSNICVRKQDQILPRHLAAYKKRNKTLQRRFDIEFQLNKKLIRLLYLCKSQLNNELLAKLIEEELKLTKYKYY